MEHIGIDLGATHSHVTVVSPEGTKARQKVSTASLPAWLATRPSSRVVMEACTQSPRIAAAGLSANHDVRVIPGQLVRALGVGARGIKTDARDADVLANASLLVVELPTVHLRSVSAREARSLLAARAQLVKSRTSLATPIKSWLRSRLIVLRGRASAKCFTQHVRDVALEHPEGLPTYIEALLASIEALSEQLAKLDMQVKELSQHDPVCKRLQGLPGVGPIVSLAYKAQIDEPTRFGSASTLGSYLALVPGEATTGGRIKRTSTLKAGPKRLKALLVQSAWTLWRTRPNDPLALWATAVAERRGKRIAVVALARKMAVVMWAMWKNGTPYDPPKATTHRTEAETSG